MKVGGCMVVKNEADVIEQVVRYHLDDQEFDMLLVVDNGSTDRTWKILQSINDRRLLLFQTSWKDGFVQDEATTEGSNLLFEKHGCDWVLPIDADEYWVSEQFGTVREAISHLLPDFTVYNTFAYDFMITELDDPEEPDFRKRMRYARLHPTPKAVLHNLGGNIKYIMIGSHLIYLHDESKRREIGVKPEVLCRYHYRYLSKKQVMRKILYKAEGYIIRTKGQWLYDSREGLHGRHVRDHYFAIREGNIDKWYQNLVKSEDTIKKGVAAGDFVQRDVLARRL